MKAPTVTRLAVLSFLGVVVLVVALGLVLSSLFAPTGWGRLLIWTSALAGGLALYLVLLTSAQPGSRRPVEPRPAREYAAQLEREIEERNREVRSQMERLLHAMETEVLPFVRQVSQRHVEQETLHGYAARLEREVEDQTRELQIQTERLLQAQKMEAIGQLAGGVAHDFNNLVTVIQGRSHFLLQRMPADDPLRRHVELIQKTAQQAASLTQQLLAYSRKQILQPKVLDLNGVVAGMEKMLRPLIGEHIEVVTQLTRPLGRVKADPGQIEQVVMNLVVNARDAMPQGGRLALATAHIELDETFVRRHPGAHPGSYVMLTVSDTGVGMDGETQTRVFEPFFTTKGPGKGTGLGLATVYGIVKQHEGYIAVQSEPGRGATFRVYLPRADHAAEAPEGPPVLAASPPGRETILVVEDDEAVRELAREILEERGYTVLTAGHPRDALQISERRTAPIPLLVTDLVMPEMNGWELADRLTAAQPEMRVLYMSGYTVDGLAAHGALRPGTAWLPKPFTPDDLARKVREVLDAPRPKA